MRPVMWLESMYEVSQSSLVTFLFAVQLDWNLGAPSSRGGWRCHKSDLHTPLGLSSWRSTCWKWHPACICMLALANKQQAEMSSICSLNHCSLPVSRPSNREDLETMQYIFMSSCPLAYTRVEYAAGWANHKTAFSLTTEQTTLSYAKGRL